MRPPAGRHLRSHAAVPGLKEHKDAHCRAFVFGSTSSENDLGPAGAPPEPRVLALCPARDAPAQGSVSSPSSSCAVRQRLQISLYNELQLPEGCVGPSSAPPSTSTGRLHLHGELGSSSPPPPPPPPPAPPRSSVTTPDGIAIESYKDAGAAPARADGSSPPMAVWASVGGPRTAPTMPSPQIGVAPPPRPVRPSLTAEQRRLATDAVWAAAPVPACGLLLQCLLAAAPPFLTLPALPSPQPHGPSSLGSEGRSICPKWEAGACLSPRRRTPSALLKLS